MMERLSVEEFDRLFTGFTRSLWRWECQPEYHEPEEVDPFARWKAGEPDDLAWLTGWCDQVREATRAGRRFERVRVLADPPTDYQTWLLAIAPMNIEAGEDIRQLEERRAADLGLPDYDFVIVDDEVAARMHFADTGFIGAEMITDAATVAEHRAWRDLAWRHAITFNAYTSRGP